MKTRIALEQDWKAIESCVADAYRGHVSRLGKLPASMGRDFRPAIERGEVHVCESKGAIVGVVVAAQRAGHLEVSSLAVRPGFQGRGIGTALMKMAEVLASSVGVRVIRLYTHVALHEVIAYYERLGYVQCGRKMEDGYDRVFLEKRLTGGAA